MAVPENQIAQNFRILKTLIRIALRLPTRTSFTEKFKDLKIGTVFENHVYEIFKFSVNQIRNGLKTLSSIGTQIRQTRNRNLTISNLPTENDRLDSRAIILITALRKWGVLPTDELICEMKQFCFQNFLHQIAGLYIFGKGEMIDLIYIYNFLAG